MSEKARPLVKAAAATYARAVHLVLATNLLGDEHVLHVSVTLQQALELTRMLALAAEQLAGNPPCKHEALSRHPAAPGVWRCDAEGCNAEFEFKPCK